MLPRMAGWAVPLGAGKKDSTRTYLTVIMMYCISIQYQCIPNLSIDVGALWFIWPAVDDGWKIEVGIKADPEAAAKAAEAAKEAPVTKVAVEEKAVAALPAAALQEIEEAPKAHAHVAETNEDKLFVKAASSGDFTYLEEKWEEFADKSTRPGEDDDDEDEEDDGESLIL